MLNKFKDWLSINGLSENTIKNYIYRIKKFLEYVKSKEISEENILSFLVKLKETSSPSTVNGYRDTISKYLKFLKKDITLPKPMKIEEKIPEYMTEKFFEEEFIPVVECIYSNPLKWKAIFYFMFYTGMRVGEVVNLRREHIDLENRIAKINNQKSKKEQIRPFNNKTKEILKMYFEIENEVSNAFNISVASVQRALNRIQPNFKNIKLHPHLFRHSFGAYFMRNGGTLATLQKLMGHKSIETTQIYAGLKPEHVREEYDKIMNRR